MTACKQTGSLSEEVLANALEDTLRKAQGTSAVDRHSLNQMVGTLLVACGVSRPGFVHRDEFIQANVGLADTLIASVGL